MRGYETRHLFMAVAIALLLLSPVFILLAPLFIANTLYHTPESWYVFVSGMSYLVYGIGCFFLVLAVFMLFLLAGQKFSIIVSLALLILSGASFYIAAQNYTSLADDSIAYRTIFSKEQHVYAWGEVERVVYKHAPNADTFAEYEFHFNDGNKMTLTENGIVRGLRDGIRNRLRQENIKIESY